MSQANRYFVISCGLRGCYADDSDFIIKVTSRKELKSIVSSECSYSREAYGYGGSKQEISSVVAQVWANRKSKKGYYHTYPFVIGFGRSRNTTDRPFGVFISQVSKTEYNEYIESNS